MVSSGAAEQYWPMAYTEPKFLYHSCRASKLRQYTRGPQLQITTAEAGYRIAATEAHLLLSPPASLPSSPSSLDHEKLLCQSSLVTVGPFCFSSSKPAPPVRRKCAGGLIDRFRLFRRCRRDNEQGQQQVKRREREAECGMVRATRIRSMMKMRREPATQARVLFDIVCLQILKDQKRGGTFLLNKLCSKSYVFDYSNRSKH